MEKSKQGGRNRFSGGVFSGTGNGNHAAAGRHTALRNDKPPYGGCYNRCAHCHNNTKSDNTALVIALIAAAVVLLLAFFATVLCLVSVFMLCKPGSGSKNISDYNKYQYGSMPYENEQPDNFTGNQPLPFEDYTEKYKDETKASEEYYGDIKDAVRTDLDYSVKWENYEYEDNSDKIMIAVDYPVIKGNIPNLDIVNDAISSETEYFVEYYDEYSKYMLPEENFGVYAEGFVTFMDEEMISVVFRETIYTDYWVDCGLHCVNIDVENGIVLNNSSILQIDDEFTIDFRNRSKEQNGEIDALDYLTDQEITYYLSTSGSSILFYTPLGMEVGLNYGEDYVTVTYKDYKNFLQKY